MNQSELLTQYKMLPESLLQYGFQKKENKYILEKKLNEDLYMKVTVDESQIWVFVYENSGDEYLPFYVNDAMGSYISEVKDSVEKYMKDIISNCFQNNNIRGQILSYVKEKYQTKEEYPWKDNPAYFTLKTKENKWYGLVIDIPYKLLGIQKEGITDVMNLKNEPSKVQAIIDYRNFFPAYHMNKKHWFSVLLNNDIDMELLKCLIDESYESVK